MARRLGARVMCSVLTATSIATGVSAQETGRIVGSVDPADDAADGLTVMVSCLLDAEIFYQIERQVGYPSTWDCNYLGKSDVPVGLYDIRVEGEGIVTEIKRGIRVLPGNTTRLIFTMRTGQGLHVVEYATGGLAREEVAARLHGLEALHPEMAGAGGAEPAGRVTAIDAESGLVTAIAPDGGAFQFEAAEGALANVRVNQLVWMDPTGRVGVSPGKPCCDIARRIR